MGEAQSEQGLGQTAVEAVEVDSLLAEVVGVESRSAEAAEIAVAAVAGSEAGSL